MRPGVKVHMSRSMASTMAKYIIFVQDYGDRDIRTIECSHCMVIAFAAMPVDASRSTDKRRFRVQARSDFPSMSHRSQHVTRAAFGPGQRHSDPDFTCSPMPWSDVIGPSLTVLYATKTPGLVSLMVSWANRSPGRAGQGNITLSFSLFFNLFNTNRSGWDFAKNHGVPLMYLACRNLRTCGEPTRCSSMIRLSAILWSLSTTVLITAPSIQLANI
jgi:hypothetical protein